MHLFVRLSLLSTIALSGLLLQSCGESVTSADKMSTEIDSVSYALGMNMARVYNTEDVTLNPAMLYHGFKDQMDSTNRKFTKEEAAAVIDAFAVKMNARFRDKMSKTVIENEIKQKEFLKENQSKEGVVVRPSGLQYRILASGSGPSPKPTDTCRVNYTARFMDGSEFDNSSMAGAQGAEVIPGQMIAGWSEALTLMKAGDKWEVFIPSDLAYGTEGYQEMKIAPNTMLIFEIELLDVR